MESTALAYPTADAPWPEDVLASQAQPTSTALAPSHPLDSIPDDGLLPASAEIRVIGISNDGELYLYGATPDTPGPTLGAVMGLITDVAVTAHGKADSKYGVRDYLDVRLQAPCPTLAYILRLPCHSGQWSYRSLLGALQTLALRDVAVKLEAKRGREATFLRVSLDPRGENVVTAPSIGADRDELEIAVNHCRRALGLEPQFS